MKRALSIFLRIHIHLGASCVPLLPSSAFSDMTPLFLQTTKLGTVGAARTSLNTEKIEISLAKSPCGSDAVISEII